MEFYEGIVSGAQSQSHAMQSGSIRTERTLMGKPKITGDIKTDILRITEFSVNGELFSCAGDIAICDGDEVRLWASGDGVKQVSKLLNITRNSRIYHKNYTLFNLIWGLCGWGLLSMMVINYLPRWIDGAMGNVLGYGGCGVILFFGISFSFKKYTTHQAQNKRLYS